MRPYYEQDGIVLYHGDAREVLPHLGRADLLLTDPPYGIDGGRGGGNTARGKGLYEHTGWEDTPAYIGDVVIPVVREALAHVERGIVMPGKPHMNIYPEPADIGAMWTPAGLGFGSWGRSVFSPILYYGRDPRAGVGQVPTGKQVTEGPFSREHPCAKPLHFWQWLMAKGSLDGETVLDPFCGAGTTLRAAKNLGRKAIGIEIEERHCELAVRMLAQQSMGLGL